MQTIIKVASGTRFMSDIPEIKEIYNNDLPHNAVIDKQVTGVGGSHIVLSNNQPYVVAVHLLKMIDNKINQDKYKHVMSVNGDTTFQEVDTYLKSGGIKFLCTYDSVPKLQKYLGSRTKDFNLLVDEVHCLIGYMDRFKPTVAINLINDISAFNSTSYLTATPTNFKYLPKPLQKLNHVKVEWEDARKPDLVHSFANRSLTEDTISTVIDKLDNTTEELYIFYNSRRYIVSLIKKILKLKTELTLDDINILFSETDDNTNYFRKYLGTKFKYGSFPDGINNKRINLISSMAYEGCDFYPNNDDTINPTSIIISDPRSKTMRFDINVQLKQICGRFRANLITDKMPINKIVYLWASQEEDIILDENEYLNIIIKSNTECEIGLENNKDNSMIMDALKLSANNHHAYWILNENKEVVMHPFAVEAQMSNYHALHSDSFVLDGNIENSTTISKLSDLSKELSTYTIPLLPSSYKTTLGRIPSIQALVKEYNSIIETAKISPTFREDLETFLTVNTTFTEWLEAGVTPQNMNTLNNRNKIEELASSLKIMAKVEEVKLPFKVDIIYTKTKIKTEIQKFYDANKIKLKAKATDINKWYIVKTTTDSKGNSAFKIVNYK